MNNSKAAMPNRERFLDICRGKRPGDVAILEWFNRFDVQTPVEWIKQGAPEEIKDAGHFFRYLQCDRVHVLKEILSEHNCVQVKGETLPTHHVTPALDPLFERKVISEDERHRIETTHGGQTVEVNKEFPWRMPRYLDHPVKDRASWNEYRKRLDPHSPGRWPPDWNAFVQKTNSEDVPTMLLLEGFFGVLREWTGMERLLYMFYDDPTLVEDMMEHVLYMDIEMSRRVLKDMRIDCVRLWEDMAYKTGPLISPGMVRKFMMPRYKKITAFLRRNGVGILHLDSDGNVNELIPLWLEVGINFPWPLEVAANMDAVALRKKYGKNIILSGNIDKRVFTRGKDAIRDEVMSKVPFLLESGGYFPGIDHVIAPDISLENYRYFINLLREVGGREKLPE